jgi:hypothetical protein
MDSKFNQSGRKIQCVLVADRQPADIESAQRPLGLQGGEEERNFPWAKGVIELVVDTDIEAFEASGGRMIKEERQERSATDTSTVPEIKML